MPATNLEELKLGFITKNEQPESFELLNNTFTHCNVLSLQQNRRDKYFLPLKGVTENGLREASVKTTQDNGRHMLREMSLRAQLSLMSKDRSQESGRLTEEEIRDEMARRFVSLEQAISKDHELHERISEIKHDQGIGLIKFTPHESYVYMNHMDMFAPQQQELINLLKVHHCDLVQSLRQTKDAKKELSYEYQTGIAKGEDNSEALYARAKATDILDIIKTTLAERKMNSLLGRRHGQQHRSQWALNIDTGRKLTSFSIYPMDVDEPNAPDNCVLLAVLFGGEDYEKMRVAFGPILLELARLEHTSFSITKLSAKMKRSVSSSSSTRAERVHKRKAKKPKPEATKDEVCNLLDRALAETKLANQLFYAKSSVTKIVKAVNEFEGNTGSIMPQFQRFSSVSPNCTKCSDDGPSYVFEEEFGEDETVFYEGIDFFHTHDDKCLLILLGLLGGGTAHGCGICNFCKREGKLEDKPHLPDDVKYDLRDHAKDLYNFAQQHNGDKAKAGLCHGKYRKSLIAFGIVSARPLHLWLTLHDKFLRGTRLFLAKIAGQPITDELQDELEQLAELSADVQSTKDELKDLKKVSKDADRALQELQFELRSTASFSDDFDIFKASSTVTLRRLQVDTSLYARLDSAYSKSRSLTRKIKARTDLLACNNNEVKKLTEATRAANTCYVSVVMDSLMSIMGAHVTNYHGGKLEGNGVNKMIATANHRAVFSCLALLYDPADDSDAVTEGGRYFHAYQLAEMYNTMYSIYEHTNVCAQPCRHELSSMTENIHELANMFHSGILSDYVNLYWKPHYLFHHVIDFAATYGHIGIASDHGPEHKHSQTDKLRKKFKNLTSEEQGTSIMQSSNTKAIFGHSAKQGAKVHKSLKHQNKKRRINET